MGKHVANTFCNLGTFVFLLYFAKVLSASTQQTISNVMKSDIDLCKVPDFIFESNITKICTELKYSEAIEFNHKNINPFLCLAFYDTWHKACKSEQSPGPFNDTATFYSYLQKFVSEDNEQAGMAFCKNVEGITFSYPKLKSLLSQMHLNNSGICYSTCFTLQEKFNHLCTILAWSVSIDRDVKKYTVDTKVNETDKTKVAKGAAAGESQIEKQVVLEKVNSNVNENKEKDSVRANQQNAAPKSSAVPATASNPASAADNPVNVQKSMVDNHTPAANQQEPALTNAATVDDVPKPSRSENSNENTGREGATNGKGEALMSGNNEERAEIREDGFGMEDNNGAKGTVQNGNGVGTGNSGARETVKNENNDGKTTMISEGTQDYDTANQRADEDQVMPKPSERRDDFITHYSNIRSDEESHFFTYFTVVSLISIAAYIGYHNKQKILAIVLEGRRSRSNRGRRRPSTASYRKLDCTLEEAVTSQCNANVTHVIY